MNLKYIPHGCVEKGFKFVKNTIVTFLGSSIRVGWLYNVEYVPEREYDLSIIQLTTENKEGQF